MVCVTQVAAITSCDSFTDRPLHDGMTARWALKCLQTEKCSSVASDLGRTYCTSPSQVSWHLHSFLGRQIICKKSWLCPHHTNPHHSTYDLSLVNNTQISAGTDKHQLTPLLKVWFHKIWKEKSILPLFIPSLSSWFKCQTLVFFGTALVFIKPLH